MKDIVEVIRDSVPTCVVDGKLSVQLLAEAVGMTRQNVWQRVMRDGMVSADMARRMIALPGSSLTAEAILPYIR